MPESSARRTSVGPMANKINDMASPKELRNSCFGIAKVCSSSLFCNIAYDLGCLYFFGAALALIVAAFGGLLFLDNETALVVETLLDDDVVKEIIEGETVGTSTEVLGHRRLLLSGTGTSQRLIGLLLQTLLLPVGTICLGLFAFHSYKTMVTLADAGRRKVPPALTASGRHGGSSNANDADSAQADARRQLDHWRWYRCASAMQAMVAIYGLLSLGFVVLAILAGATFINALLVTVCKKPELCSFVRKSSQDTSAHVAALDDSGLGAMTTVMGVVYIAAPMGFAFLFAILLLRTIALRSSVLHRRAKAGGLGLLAQNNGRSKDSNGSTKYGNGISSHSAASEMPMNDNEDDEDVDDDDEEEDVDEEDEYGSSFGSGFSGFIGNGYSAGEGEASPLMGGSGVSPLPSRRVMMKEHARQPHRHRKNKTKAGVLLLVFLVMYPLLFVAAVALPDSFSAISTSAGGAASVAAKDSSRGKGLAFAGFAHAHLDLVLFYAFLYLSVLLGLLGQFSDPLRRFLLRRSKFVQAYAPSGLPYSISNLGVVLLLLLGAMLGGETFYYIKVHDFDRMDGSDLPASIEKVARVMGSLCKVTMGLLVLPVARNSVWSVAFGLPRSIFVGAHTVIGNCWVLMVLVHVTLMTVASNTVGKNVLSAFPENYSVGLISVSASFSLVCVGIFAREAMRRKYHELFIATHVLSMSTLFPAVLWHADGAWKFVLGGASLWLIDHVVRFARACMAVQCKDAKFMARSGEVLRLAYVVDSGGKICSHPSSKRPKTALLHGMGQHVYLNVPEISQLEWHPFSISSAAEDRVTTHHIKSQGPGTFTSKLHDLFRQAIDEGRLSKVRVNVDGPYGVPLEYQRYEKIIFVAGGIGITNIHSSFKTLYVLAKAGLLPVTRVHLIWVAKDASYFDMFQDTFRIVGRDSLHARFKVSCYVTQEENVNSGKSSSAGSSSSSNHKGSSGYNGASSNGSLNGGVPIEFGRPNLLRELVGLSAYGMHALVAASGPPELRETCHRLAIKCGVDFQDECFQL